MPSPIRVVIITGTNIKTSLGSNNTVLNLLENLDQKKYRISISLLDDLVPDKLLASSKLMAKDPAYVSFEKVKNHPKVSQIYVLSSLSIRQLKKMFDFAIVAVYNGLGEDGKIIGMLDLAGIPYLSHRLSSSVVAFDKEFTKAVLARNGLLVPKSVEINKDDQLPDNLSFPIMVKPVNNGASRGTSLVKKNSELVHAVDKAFIFSEEVLLEEYLDGDEFTVGVTGHYTNPTALPAVMIKTKNDFFDYEAKYKAGKAEEICPAPVSQAVESVLRKTAIQAYRAIKAENHSRVDMIKKGNNIYVLEINSFPGLMPNSLFPKELAAAGISMTQFLDRSIEEKIKD